MGGATEEKTIRISNLRGDVSEAAVRGLCNEFGNIIKVYVPLDDTNERIRGFAFVTYDLREDAVKALNALKDHKFANSLLSVEWAKTPKHRSEDGINGGGSRLYQRHRK